MTAVKSKSRKRAEKQRAAAERGESIPSYTKEVAREFLTPGDSKTGKRRD